MIIGFLVGGMLTRMRVDKMQSYYTEMGFNREFIRLLEPTPKQREAIIPILKKYGELNHELMLDFRSNQKELFFEFKNELGEHLNDIQMKKLNRIWDKRKHHFQNSKNNRSRKNKRKPPPN